MLHVLTYSIYAHCVRINWPATKWWFCPMTIPIKLVKQHTHVVNNVDKKKVNSTIEWKVRIVLVMTTVIAATCMNYSDSSHVGNQTWNCSSCRQKLSTKISDLPGIQPIVQKADRRALRQWIRLQAPPQTARQTTTNLAEIQPNYKVRRGDQFGNKFRLTVSAWLKAHQLTHYLVVT